MVVQLLELLEFVPYEIENHARSNKTDDAAHADIRQEMLRKIDTRVSAKCCNDQERQHQQIHQDTCPAVVLYMLMLVVVG